MLTPIVEIYASGIFLKFVSLNNLDFEANTLLKTSLILSRGQRHCL